MVKVLKIERTCRALSAPRIRIPQFTSIQTYREIFKKSKIFRQIIWVHLYFRDIWGSTSSFGVSSSFQAYYYHPHYGMVFSYFICNQYSSRLLIVYYCIYIRRWTRVWIHRWCNNTISLLIVSSIVVARVIIYSQLTRKIY